MDARFSLPDFYLGKETYSTFVALKDECPETVLPHTEISAIFGNFPGALWNGGGINLGPQCSRDEVQDVINYYNYELNIPLRFTFTNALLTEEHCHDTYCNMIAECGNNGHNQILVVAPVLERYLRKKYTNYKYCRSIISARDVPYLLNGPFGPYYYSVIRRIHNNDWEFLSQIPEIERPRIEFLCTDPCPDNCPRLYTHYRDFARAQIEMANNDQCACTMAKVKGRFVNHYARTQLKTYITREMIDKEYLPQGFCEFKCSGRGSILGGIFALKNYCINPEYEDDVMLELLSVNNIT